MKYYFLDTSALVKRYHEEKGTRVVDKIFEVKDKVILISNLTISEFVSAINKKKNEGKITKEDLELTLSRFFTDIFKEFVVIKLEDSHIASSLELILKHELRAMDSLLLATVIEVKDVDTIFVSADDKLCEAAKKEGLETVNPEN